ncbi:MAG: DPP IV N-terminal domain-containing protein [Pseudomonadota bacterium]
MISETGQSKPLFDHDILASELSNTLNTEINPGALPIRLVQYQAANKTFEAVYGGQKIVCDLTPEISCSKVKTAVTPGLLFSPDNSMAAFTRGNNVWLKELATGKERPLTNDGTPFYAWGKRPDTSLSAIPEQRDGRVMPPFLSEWSPDSSKLIVYRTDERNVGVYPFVEWTPADGKTRPQLYQLRIPMLGEELPNVEVAVIDVASGERWFVEDVPGYEMLSPVNGIIGWSDLEDKAYFLVERLGAKALALVQASKDGTQVLYEEESNSIVRHNQSLYGAPNIHLINNKEELLWFSERSGWGHIYRIDLKSGNILNAVTSGEWTVLDIIKVDDDAEVIYFTAGGREEGRDPYYRHLYKVRYDGTELTLLTPENANHGFSGSPSQMLQMLLGAPVPPQWISPDGRFAVATYATMKEPSVTVLRDLDNDGEVIAEVARADVRKLENAGFTPPERFSAIAADGETPIYGVMYFPSNFNPHKKYPVVNALYAGPQVITAPVDYMEASGASALSGQINRTALANLGFIVVTVDGRGTPFRSRSFQMASFGEHHGDVTLNDHRAALEQLGAERPYMDLSRVGVYGSSWGGYHAARAILIHNDFYDAAVASAGVHTWHTLYGGFERFIGLPDYGDGVAISPTPNAVPENYVKINNTTYADQLVGHLLIMYYGNDENVPPSTNISLVKALAEAGKDFDLFYVPNQPHYYFAAPYAQAKIWRYMVEHVMKAPPPEFDMNMD